MNLDKEIRELVDGVVMPIPTYSWDIFGVTIFVWEESKYCAEPLETEPYQLDGSVPLIFLQIGRVEFIFENKLLYKLLYKRKFRHLPMGLK